jgi:hypothetical protein
MSRKHKRQSIGQYTAFPRAIEKQPAWKAMSPYARLVWLRLRGWLRGDGLNNGKIGAPCRQFGEELGFDKDTVARALIELEHYGFIIKTAPGFLGSDGYGIFAKYRFTDLAHGTHSPTRDYEKWEGEKFVYTPRKPGRKKQKPVPSEGTTCPAGRDIRTAPGKGSVCPVGRDIEEPPTCPAGRDISSLPLVKASIEEVGRAQQGGVTASTPAQAGGAGSSPAPVAKPDLTTMVLGIVTAQLDELDRRREAARHPQHTETVTAIAGPTSRREAPAGATIFAPQPYGYGSKRPPRIYGCGYKQQAAQP